VKESYIKAGDYVKKGDPLLQVEENPISHDDPLQILSVLFEQNFVYNNQLGAVLYADMDGIVTECTSVGEKLYPMQTAVKLADFSQAVVTIEIPELYAPGISVGQTARACLVSEQEKVFSGKITEIDTQVKQKMSILNQESNRTVDCRVTLSETEEMLRPGSSMDVSIITDSIEKAVTIPYSGVHQMDTQEYVYVVSTNGIEKRFVETGYHMASEIQIKKGVLDGEWVLTDEDIPEDLSNGYTVVQS
jgi:RND family efflux transporter MFP subunit